MSEFPPPSLDEFLQSSLEDVRRVAPSTLIYAASGTRRAAALAGVETSGDKFAQWSKGELFRCIDLIFQHGVEHLFMPMLGPSQFQENTANYREHLWRWFIDGLAGPDAIAHYQRAGWRVRFAFGEFIPPLQEATELLLTKSPTDARHTLWCYAVPDFQRVWSWVIEAVQGAGAMNYADAVQAIYGEQIPPAAIYLGTVKPLISAFQLPPLLVVDEVECYWSQRPGYSLDEKQLRSILYDYAFLRKTWLEDKTDRAEQALADQEIWRRGDVLGLGERLGPFWHPK